MTKQIRSVVVAAASVEPREAEFDGRKFLVVPVVALVEGVIQAMNAATPELVTAEEFTKAPLGWNGRPLFYGHPVNASGQPVSGNSPDILEAACVGMIFNAAIRKNKLTMEAWVDIEKAEAHAPELLERISNGDPIEVSVGVFTDTDDSTGEYNGKRYAGAWHEIVPDHLALLRVDEVGACSRDMGCGVRAAKGATVKSDKTNGNIFSRLMSAFRGSQSASEMSDNDVRSKIAAALRDKDPRAYYPDAVYDGYFVYCVYDGNDMDYYRRDYALAADGNVTISDTFTEVEPVLSYEPVDSAALETAKETPKAAAAAPCQCHKNQPVAATSEERNMSKEKASALVSKLTGKGFVEADAALFENASDEQFARLESLIPAAEVVAPVVAAAIPEVKTASAAPTFEDILATASPEVRDSIAEGMRVGAAKREATIKTLKDSGRCDYTDAQFKAMSQADLDRLVKLANVKAAVDFSGQAPRQTEVATPEAPAAPDLGAAIRASREKK